MNKFDKFEELSPDDIIRGEHFYHCKGIWAEGETRSVENTTGWKGKKVKNIRQPSFYKPIFYKKVIGPRFKTEKPYPFGY